MPLDTCVATTNIWTPQKVLTHKMIKVQIKSHVKAINFIEKKNYCKKT